jgi:hypothetical protein
MRAWWLAAAALASLAVLAAQAPAEDPVLRAMREEIQRSRELTLSNLEKPYFIQYVLDQEDNFTVSATLGGLLMRRREQARQPTVQVRVGDYKFDNTNFAGGGMGMGSRYDLGRFPLEDAYPVVRRYFWLATDSSYKAAVEAISRKRAALRNVTQNDPLEDFARAQPVHSIRELGRQAIDETAWTNRVKSLSALFTAYPQIRNSQVELDSGAGGFYLVNSEGTEVREPETVTSLRVQATAQAADGMVVRQNIAFLALDPSRMRADAEVESAIRELAGNVVKLAAAPKGEEYSGPVLFEGEAAPQLFAQLLGKNLVLGRRPQGGRGGSAPLSDFEGRVGARVLPDSFTVVDDPTQKEWRGRPLFGSYDVDREGVQPGPLRLVEKGVLKGYLLTRQPVRGGSGSNGRARLPGGGAITAAAISNLFVSSSDTVPASTLKSKLIELLEQRDKPYGMIVRRMDFPSAAPLDEARRLLAASPGSANPVSAPVLLYKVYRDGREELVRGLHFRALNARSLRDILAAGDDNTVFEFMDNIAPFAMMGAAGFSSEACVVAPSVVVDDLELAPFEDELPKLPVVSPPDLTR